MAYTKAAELFRKALTEAGYGEIATGLHSLRAGGATAYANADEGGMLVATAMGGGGGRVKFIDSISGPVRSAWHQQAWQSLARTGLASRKDSSPSRPCSGRCETIDFNDAK